MTIKQKATLLYLDEKLDYIRGRAKSAHDVELTMEKRNYESNMAYSELLIMMGMITDVVKNPERGMRSVEYIYDIKVNARTGEVKKL